MNASLREILLAYPFYILPHHLISRGMYKLARIRQRSLKNFIIKTYTKLNPVKMEEAVTEDMFAYEHLNAFFTRALKPECRPFDETPNSWLCPVDGSVSQAREINKGQIFQAKGHDYSLLELLGGDENLARPFEDGHFSTLYLSPRDYHRIHMPIKATLKHMAYIPGRLFSVATHTVNVIPRLFSRNERCVCHFETKDGPMIMVLVGAINVSAMETVWHDGIITTTGKNIRRVDYKDNEVVLERGEEMGRFNLGSTVIVIGTKQLEWDAKIQPGADIKLGQRLGSLAH
jgi:phosphatidylserine decarboxylase